MRQPLVQFPQSREAPQHVIEGLRRLDPTTEIVYMGDGRWLVGRVRLTNDRRRIATSILDHAHTRLSMGARLSPAGGAKITLALLGLQGFAPIAEYRLVGAPTSAIVDDIRRALWMLTHTTDDQLFRDLEADKERAKAEARADLADEARARDAWRYMFTRQHAVTRVDETTKPHYRSGFTSHKPIGHAA